MTGRHNQSNVPGSLVLGRIIKSWVLPTSGSYDIEKGLHGWYAFTAENDPAYILPMEGTGAWDCTNMGILIPTSQTRIIYLDHDNVGYYSARGVVRCEQIEPAGPSGERS